MVVTLAKPKITFDTLFPGEDKPDKTKKPKKPSDEDEEGEDKRSYEAERCDDKDIRFNVGYVYHGGDIDTDDAVKDVLSMLKRKGVI